MCIDKKTAMDEILSASNIAEEVGHLDRKACLRMWKELHQHAPPKYLSLPFLRKALAFEQQIRSVGKHPPIIRRALKNARRNDINLRSSAVDKGSGDASASTISKSLATPTPCLRSGTHLVREWNGRTHHVEVLESGFMFDGREYRSLSAIAKRITGAHWSGPRFFGLRS